MSDFWRIFKRTAYFRLSWSIQDSFISAIRQSQTNKKLKEERESLVSNQEEILNAIYDNDFQRHREKK